MRATFARYSTCGACTGAGYGWCTIQRRCGGFANRECGEGERYVSEGTPASRAKPSRNAAWPKFPPWTGPGFGSGQLVIPRGKAGPRDAQPLPWVREPAAPKGRRFHP